MPIYEYLCAACNKRSSALLRSYSAPDPKCPHCGKKRLRRLVSTFATVRSEEGGGDDFDSRADDHSHDHGGDDFGGDDEDY